MLAEPKRSRGPEVLKKIGEHPTKSGVFNVFDGRYGPYVNHEKINATIPSTIEPAELDMEKALQLLEEQEKRKLSSKKKKPTKKKTVTKKKKSTKKKTITKKKKSTP